jgi:hypothetical protein
MSGSHFIVYGARHGAKSFFEGISDPTFFMSINRILDEGFYQEYFDPRLERIFSFPGLLEFVTDRDGLDIADWVPFMKALWAQDEGTAPKVLYGRMIGLDERLDLLVESATAAIPMPKPLPPPGPGPGRGYTKAHDDVRGFSEPGYGNSQTYLLRRLARDQPSLLSEIGQGKRFKSARAAAIEAGIITPFPSLQLKEAMPTAQKLLAKKGKEWCLQLLDELSTLVFED